MIKVQNINFSQKINSNCQQRQSINLHSQPKMDTVSFSGGRLKPGELDEAIELLKYVTGQQFVKVSDTEIYSQKFFSLPKTNDIKEKFKNAVESAGRDLQYYISNNAAGDFARNSYNYSRLSSYHLTEDASLFRYNKKTKQMEAPLKATIIESSPINRKLLSPEMDRILNEQFSSNGNEIKITAPETSYILRQGSSFVDYLGRPKGFTITKL